MLQNGFCESFKVRMRDAFLSAPHFAGLAFARKAIRCAGGGDNRSHLHSAPGCITPVAYAGNLIATSATPTNSTDRLLLIRRHTAYHQSPRLISLLDENFVAGRRLRTHPSHSPTQHP